MSLHIGGCGCLQPPGFELLKGLVDRGGVAIVNLDAGRLENPEGFGSAMPADQAVGAGADDIFRRLDSGSLGRVEVLGVIDQCKGVFFQIENQKPGGAAETDIQWSIEVFPGGAKGDFHGIRIPFSFFCDTTFESLLLTAQKEVSGPFEGTILSA